MEDGKGKMETGNKENPPTILNTSHNIFCRSNLTPSILHHPSYIIPASMLP